MQPSVPCFRKPNLAEQKYNAGNWNFEYIKSAKAVNPPKAHYALFNTRIRTQRWPYPEWWLTWISARTDTTNLHHSTHSQRIAKDNTRAQKEKLLFHKFPSGKTFVPLTRTIENSLQLIPYLCSCVFPCLSHPRSSAAEKQTLLFVTVAPLLTFHLSALHWW